MSEKTKQGKPVAKFLYALLFLAVSSSLMLSGGCTKPGLTEVNERSGSGNLFNFTTVRMVSCLKLDGDTGSCPYGPGFCPDYSSPLVPTPGWIYGAAGDAIVDVTLNPQNSTLTMSFVEFREDWFDEGGYLDNTFSAPEMKLDKNVAEVLGANSITLQHGVYEMIQDGETGNYVVTIDVKFE